MRHPHLFSRAHRRTSTRRRRTTLLAVALAATLSATVAGVVPVGASSGDAGGTSVDAVVCCAREYHVRGDVKQLSDDGPVVVAPTQGDGESGGSDGGSGGTNQGSSSGSAPDLPAPLDLPGNSFLDYVTLPGDQVVVVPNGTYTAGTVSAPHPATSGQYRGWLVLVAESRGGVVIDLTDADLELTEETNRVMFVGFSFVKGSVDVDGSHIRFWYTDHTFTPEEWAIEQNYARRAPRTMYIDKTGSHHVELYGVDLHDTGTAIMMRKVTDVLFQGIHIWNIGEKNLDPQDVIHPDAIGVPGGDIKRLTVRDSHLEGRNMFITKTGDILDLLFDNVWSSEAPGIAHQFVSKTTTSGAVGRITGIRRNVRSFSHNGAGKDRVDVYDGVQSSGFNVNTSRINVVDESVTLSAPASGAKSPAQAWREANPYGSWTQLY